MIGGTMSSKLTIAGFIAALAMMGTATSAQAADLGGDCCADLEERVAELEATTARKGNSKVSLTIYGQVNMALLTWDDGNTSDAYVVDNDSSTSRFGFKGKAKINSDWSAGYRIEIGVYATESDRVDQGFDDDDTADSENIGDDGDGNRMELRRSEMFIKSKTYGKVSWGLTSHALDGTTKSDLSGTHVIARNAGLRFVEDFFIADAAGGYTTRRWGNIFDGDTEFDRDNVIRYDTPTLAGFKVSASWGEDDEWSVAAFYKGEFQEIKIAAAIGYGEDDECDAGDPDDCSENINGSFSIMHTPTGLFITASGGQLEKGDGAEDEFYQIKGGIQQKWNSLGKTTFYGEYINAETDDTGEGDIWGLGVVQKIDAAKMEVYAGYRHYEADLHEGPETEDFQTLVTGARIKF